MKALLISLLVFFSGCAIYGDVSSGVVPLGPDTYMISIGGHEIISTPNSLRIKAIKEASNYCSAQGKNFRITSDTDSSTGPWIDYESEIQFMCLDKGDSDLTRPIKRDADIIIETR